MIRAALPPAQKKLIDALSKPTKATRARAEAALLELIIERDALAGGVASLAAPLVETAASGSTGSAAAMRLLGALIGDGDCAISTGPIPRDKGLVRWDAPYAKHIASKRMRAVAALLAEQVPGIEAALDVEDAVQRGSAAYLIAHIPEAKRSLANVAKRATQERDVEVLAALVFASGFLARYAGKEPLAAPASAPPAVRACAALARVVATGCTNGAADEAALVDGILAAPLDAARFPWRGGALDKVVSTVVDNRMGAAAAATLLTQAITRAPTDERSKNWAAVTLSLGFQERDEPMRAEELTPPQRALLADLSQQDWKPLTTEFKVYGLPPHASDRRALLAPPASSEGSLFDRLVPGPKRTEKLVDALRRRFKDDLPFEKFHDLLSEVLTPAEHLEVAQQASAQRLGLSHMGDAGPMAIARRDATACVPWASGVLEAARTTPATPRGDFWVTLALFIMLSAKRVTSIDPALDGHIRADARIAEIVETVLRALPAGRADAVLARFVGKDVKTASLAFLPLAFACPTTATVEAVLDTTAPKRLAAELGAGAPAWVKTKILPQLPKLITALAAPQRARVEARLAELRALAN
jgi:hypothetical protein